MLLIQTEFETPSRFDRAVAVLVFLWLVGTMLWEKQFSYIHIGPVYVTEFILALLLIKNFSQLTRFDFFYIACIVGFTVAGTLKNHSWFFAGKDMAWFYYPLFLKFFPKDISEKYFAPVMLCAVFSLIFGRLPIFVFNKYGAAIIFFFVYSVAIHRPKFIGRWPLVLMAAGFAYTTGFKTAMLGAMAYPFLIKVAPSVRGLLNPLRLLTITLILFWVIYLGYAIDIMGWGIDLLNGMTRLLHIQKSFSMDTSLWRNDIWVGGLRVLFQEKSLIFGDLPGRNLIDAKLLGATHLQGFDGGESLGFNRSAHNILIQAVTKTGIAGLFIWFMYLVENMPKRQPVVLAFQFVVFFLGMTNDTFEVPSRAPLFFCLIWILSSYVDRVATAPAPTLEPERSLDLVRINYAD